MTDLPSYEAIQSAPRFSAKHTGEFAQRGDLLRLSVADLVFALSLRAHIDWLGREAEVIFIDRAEGECVIRFSALPAGSAAMAAAFGRAKYERVQALLRGGVALFDEVVTRNGDMYPEMRDWCDLARKEMP